MILEKKTKIISDEDTSRLIKKVSIFSKLSTVNFFKDTNATGFTANRSNTSNKTEYKHVTGQQSNLIFINSGKFSFPFIHTVNFFKDTNATGFTANRLQTQNVTEYKYVRGVSPNLIFINSGRLSTPYINAVDYFSGVFGKWGAGTFPRGFTIRKKITEFLNYDNSELIIPSLRHEVNQYNMNLQLGPIGSVLFKHTGFYYNNKYSDYYKFGEKSLKSNSLFDKSKARFDGNMGDISFDYRNLINVYGKSVFNVRINDDNYAKYWELFDDFQKNLPEQDSAGILPYLKFKDGSDLNKYYKQTENKYNRLSILNNPSRGRLLFSEPFIVTRIGKRYGFFNDIPSDKIISEKGDDIISISDFLTRGGITTAIGRTVEDLSRISQFLLSERGLLFLIKQTGLQRMSPRQETSAGLTLAENAKSSVNLFKNILLSTSTNFSGIRFSRHNTIVGIDSVYSNSNEVNTAEYLNNNRLISIKKSLFMSNHSSAIFNLSATTNVHGIYGIPFTSTLGINRLSIVKSINGVDITGDEASVLTGRSKTVSYKYLTHSGLSIKSELTDEDPTAYEQSLITGSFKIYNTYNESKIPEKTNLGSLYSGESRIATSSEQIDRIYPIKEDKDNYSDTFTYDIVVVKFAPIFDPYRFDTEATLYTKNRPLTFRAIVDTFTDTFSPSYNTVSYVGNPINFPVYQNTKRSINISFTVPTYYEDEIPVIQNKLNDLASYCWPAATKDMRISTPFIKFTYGTWADNLLAIITSVSYNIDTNTPWNIDIEFPHVVKVQVNMDILPDKVPFAGTRNVAQIGKKKEVVSTPMETTPTPISTKEESTTTKKKNKVTEKKKKHEFPKQLNFLYTPKYPPKFTIAAADKTAVHTKGLNGN